MINDYQGVVVFLCPSLICLWLISFRCLFHQSLLCHFSGSRCCPPQGQGVLTDSWVQHLDTGLCPHHYSWSSHAGPLSDGHMNSHLLLEWYFFKKDTTQTHSLAFSSSWTFSPPPSEFNSPRLLQLRLPRQYSPPWPPPIPSFCPKSLASNVCSY